MVVLSRILLAFCVFIIYFSLFLGLVLSFVLSVLVDLINASPQVHRYYPSYSQTLRARLIGKVRLSEIRSLWRDQVG